MSRTGWLALAGAAIAVVASLAAWQTTTTTVIAAPTQSPTEAPSDTSSSPGPTTVAAVLGGDELFHAKGCATCHTGPESTAVIGGFPSLRAARTWAGERRPGMDAADYLTESIRAPSAFVSPAFAGAVGPTGAMPELGLTEAEIDALVDHLLSA